jgi:aspartyl-tRNA synthetase
MNKYRTHNCSELSEKEIDKNVYLSGWLHRKRDHGNLLFIDLRDHYGITQCVIENNNKFFSNFRKIKTRVSFKNKWKSC